MFKIEVILDVLSTAFLISGLHPQTAVVSRKSSKGFGVFVRLGYVGGWGVFGWVLFVSRAK